MGITTREIIAILLIAGSVGGLAHIYQKYIKEYSAKDLLPEEYRQYYEK
jgi:uncharacterized membrane protein